MKEKARSRWLAVNDQGYRIGESHAGSVLTDHEVELLHAFLAEREELLAQCRAVRMGRREIQRTLVKHRLSFALLAVTFEVSKSTVFDIATGRTRGQAAKDWRKG